ncbi:hypothetical protein EcB7A_1842 [Escherichia coli B7A]|nr:hypothetical protein EcB7A_1842 [Escherichia coli B7A]
MFKSRATAVSEASEVFPAAPHSTQNSSNKKELIKRGGGF